MSGPLTHSPAAIVRQILVDLDLGVMPPASPWPVFTVTEPDSPDDAITVYGTSGRDHGRSMIDGRRSEMHGVQIRIRATRDADGYAKARAIAVALDENVLLRTVTIGASSYLVHAISRTSDVLDLLKESFNTQRALKTVNALLSVKMI